MLKSSGGNSRKDRELTGWLLKLMLVALRENLGANS